MHRTTFCTMLSGAAVATVLAALAPQHVLRAQTLTLSPSMEVTNGGHVTLMQQNADGTTTVMDDKDLHMGEATGQGISQAISGVLGKLLQSSQSAAGNTNSILVLNDARASNNDVIALTHELQAGKVRIKAGGVRVVAGDTEEAKKYDAGPNDQVVIISTESTGE
jgi:hypothetical protein